MTIQYKTLDEIVQAVFEDLQPSDFDVLKQVQRDDMIQFHHSVGMFIRNQYLLWDENNPLTMLNYEPQVVNGMDENPKHPDAVSQEILRRVWDLANEQPE